MCYLSMGETQKALDDANKSVELNPEYAKGYFRRGMAQMKLNNFSGAKESFEESLRLAPGDKAVTAQLAKAVEGLSSGSTKSTKSTASGTASSSSSRSASAKSAKTSTVEDSVDDGDESVAAGSSSSASSASAASAFRGYKLTSDGRKTTFFNNEMDDATKALIGDIAPKKLDAAAAPVSVPEVAAGGSVWNQAGTYEEKIFSPWARDRMKSLLMDVEVDLTVTSGLSAFQLGTVKISSVKSVAGDAQITINRGKRKYIYDLTAEVEWRVEVTNMQSGAVAATATGTLSLEDMSADSDYEITSVAVNKTTGDTALANSVVSKAVKSNKGALQTALAAVVKQFNSEFMEK